MQLRNNEYKTYCVEQGYYRSYEDDDRMMHWSVTYVATPIAAAVREGSCSCMLPGILCSISAFRRTMLRLVLKSRVALSFRLARVTGSLAGGFFFFRELPCGPCDLVSQKRNLSKREAINMNLGKAPFAGETVIRQLHST